MKPGAERSNDRLAALLRRAFMRDAQHLNLRPEDQKYENEHKQVLAIIDRFFSCHISYRDESPDAIIASESKRLAAAGFDNLQLREWGCLGLPGIDSFDIDQHNGRWRSRQLIVGFSQHEPRLSECADVGLSR
jgi:hypothetical protein